MNNSCLIK